MSEGEEMHAAAAPAAAENESKEPVTAALTREIGAPVYAVVMFLAFACVVIGTPISWATRYEASEQVEVTMWKIKTTTSTTETTSMVSDFACENQTKYFRTVGAFAIITIGFATFALIAGVLAAAKKTSLAAAKVLAGLVFFASLVTWAIGVRVYYKSFCGASSFNNRYYEIGPGGALFVTAWVLSFVALVFAHKNPTVPAALPEAVLDRFAASLFVVLMLIVLTAETVATPIAQAYFHDGTGTSTYVSLWKYEVKVNGDTTMSENVRTLACGDMAKLFKFGEAFAIATIGLSLFSFVAGILSVKGVVGKKVTLPLSLLTSVSAACAVGSFLAIYYQRHCDQASLDAQFYQFGAGFALLVTALAVSLFASLLLVVVAIAGLSSATEGSAKPTAFLFIFGTLAATLFCVLGTNLTLFSRVEGVTFDRYTYWRHETFDGSAHARVPFGCRDISQHLNGGGALLIIACPLTFIALVLGVGQLTSGNLRVPAAIAGFAASIPQVAAWACAVAVYWGNMCDNDFYSSDFKFRSGVGLTITAWCVTVIVSILNIVIG